MFDAFDPYVRELEELVNGAPANATTNFDPHLNGEAGRQLRLAIPIDDLRRSGAFFTGEALASRLLALVPDSVERYSDPACGCGDLLLAASSRLPVKSSLEETLHDWNQWLSGRDVVPEFIRVCRARLVMAAIRRGARPSRGSGRPTDLLDSISVGNSSELSHRSGTAVLFNPPYGLVSAPNDCSWTTGKTTGAAVFLDQLLDSCAPGVRIAALLPEVIRAGSRYERLRAEIENRLQISSIQPEGLFDALTDVDVFLLAGERRQPGLLDKEVSWVPGPPSQQLGEICDVRIGPVVANRDPHLGPWRLYLEARDIGGKTEFSPKRHRRFKGTLFDPPFVAVGRTNRANRSEGPRLRGTVVLAAAPVAVENHLVVLLPKDNSIPACEQIVQVVESKQASDFMDHRLRCRHLTVKALREMPR